MADPVSQTTGPYRADLWPRDIDIMSTPDITRWNVMGPNIAGGWHGTVPQSHDGMTQENARRLAYLLNLAYHAGARDAKSFIRGALGL